MVAPTKWGRQPSLQALQVGAGRVGVGFSQERPRPALHPPAPSTSSASGKLFVDKRKELVHEV